MRKGKPVNLAYVWIAAGVFITLFPQPAYAYLDPGTGSLIWQILLAGGFSVAYFVRRHWKRIVRIFKRDSTPDKPDDQEDPGE
jgi:O-antigen/teichoic acid export membrane protein